MELLLYPPWPSIICLMQNQPGCMECNFHANVLLPAATKQCTDPHGVNCYIFPGINFEVIKSAKFANHIRLPDDYFHNLAHCVGSMFMRVLGVVPIPSLDGTDAQSTSESNQLM